MCRPCAGAEGSLSAFLDTLRLCLRVWRETRATGRPVRFVGRPDVAPVGALARRLGGLLARDLAAHGPTTPTELAQRTGTAEPYAREWLNAQAAG